MTARVLDGRPLAAELRESLGQRVQVLLTRGFAPRLTVVVVGEDEAVRLYARRLEKAGAQLDVEVQVDAYPQSTSDHELTAIIHHLNESHDLDGAMVGMPLPAHLSADVVASQLAPEKDVDGFTVVNAGLVYLGRPAHIPSTAAAIMHLLHANSIPVSGRNVVVVGRSPVVGKPAGLLLLRDHATVTFVHTRTADLSAHLSTADIVVAAAGRAGLVRGSMLKPGCTVIDAGINVVDGAVRGDVDFEEAVEIAGAITPVPGGVGPLTNVLLLSQVIANAERRAGLAG